MLSSTVRKCVCGRFKSGHSSKCKICLKIEIGSKNLLKRRNDDSTLTTSGEKVQKIVCEGFDMSGNIECSSLFCDESCKGSHSESVVPVTGDFDNGSRGNATNMSESGGVIVSPEPDLDSVVTSLECDSLLSSVISGTSDFEVDCIKEVACDFEDSSIDSEESGVRLERQSMLSGLSSDESTDDDMSEGSEDRVDTPVMAVDMKEEKGCPKIIDYGYIVECSHYCGNCHRCESPGFEGLSCYDVAINFYNRNEISFRAKKWRTFDSRDFPNGTIPLCMECYSLLSVIEDRRRKANRKRVEWIDIWPVYVWKLLSDKGFQEKFGWEILNFIPVQWHGYWLSELIRIYPALGERTHDTIPLCVDITKKRSLFQKVRKDLSLGAMKKVYNALLVPVCLCPWGCSSYYFEKGSCHFDAVMHRFFPSIPSTGSCCSSSAIERLESAREDFFLEPDMHLFNPDWKVLPSVYFEDNVGPVFLTCKEHNGGTNFKYFHLPKCHSVLPSKHSSSLSLAVFRSRTLKPTVPMKYSNGYRLQKCQATYCGVDTAYVSEIRNFDYVSHIEHYNEASAFANRSDIQGLSSSLVNSGTLPEAYLEDLKDRSETLFGQSLELMSVGSTMTTLPEALKLQKLLASSSVVQLQITAGSDESYSFIPNWSSSLIFVHQNDGYGSKFAEIPMYRAVSNKGLPPVCLISFWFFCHCASSIPELWEELHASIKEHGACQGFFLAYAARVLLKQKGARGKRRNPFYVPTSHPSMKPAVLLKDLLTSQSILGHIDKELMDIIRHRLDQAKVNIVEISRDHQGTLADAIRLSGGCTEDCRALFVFGKRGALEERLSIEGHELELRLMGFTEGLLDARKPNKWTGEVWRRHGLSFKRWWVSSRSPLGTRTWKEDCMNQCQMEKLSFAVYCRVEDIKYCEYRRQYLKYIGGQNHVFCKKHDVPLITSKIFRKKTGKRCCNVVHGVVCLQHEDICCPIEGCKVCMCKACRKDCDEEHVTFLEVETSEDGLDSNESCDSSAAEEDDFSSCASTQSGESHGNEWDDNSPVSMLHTGCDAPMFDLEHSCDADNLGENEDDQACEGLIPTTLCGALPTSFGNSLGSMGTSVLLNKFGTVLVRRNNRLQATRKERNIVERVVAREPGNCIPLLYLEGMIFPSIFWSQPNACLGGLLGSIPTALFCQHETRKRFHIASLADHAKVRLKCCGSLASTCPNYLTFMFDCLANGALEGQDTRVVLSRGFEESMGPAGMRMRNGEDDFYTDTIDNRQCCHNLCASERDKPNSLFLTLTCNQREHFGVSHVKRYVDSPEALLNYKEHLRRKFPGERELSAREEDEIRFSLQEAARNLIVRNWMEVRLILIRYLLRSPEEPIGKVLKIFVRDEYQKESGNLSHLHILITLVEDYRSPDGRMKIEGLIRGFVDEIVGLDEVEAFIAEGVLESWEDYWEMKEQASRILPHSCDSHRCLRRVGPHTNELVCRVPDTRKLSMDLMSFYEKEIEVEHNGEAIQLYERLGFCKNMLESNGKFCPTVDFLQAKRILAPARFGEGNITPVLGKLFAATRSSMNVQICTSFGTSRYVVKYITKIDENNYVVFSVSEGNHEVYKTELVTLHNTKITSSAINEEKKLKAGRHRSRPRGRAIAATEMMQIILGFPQVYTNVEYIKVQTLPMGDRPGLERQSPAEKYEAKLKSGCWTNGKAPDLYSYCIPQVQARENLFRRDAQSKFRLFTTSQRALLRDQVHSPVTVDRVTIFGIRPPELLFIDKMEWYFKFFHRSNYPLVDENTVELEEVVTRNLQSSYWIDGLGYQIRIRPQAIQKLSDIMDSASFHAQTRKRGHIKMLQLFQTIFSYHRTAGITAMKKINNSSLNRIAAIQWDSMQEALVAIELEESLLPIPVFSNVRPKNATKFIIHTLLSMGHFETEIDLWNNHSLRHAFIKARLLEVDDIADITSDTCDRLLKEWIADQLQYYPISSRTMDDYVCSANSIFRSILLGNEIPIDELPPCLYTNLVHDTNEKVLMHKRRVKSTLIAATLNGLSSVSDCAVPSLPSHQSLMEATKSHPLTEVTFLRSNAQSIGSFQEQEKVLLMCKDSIRKYCIPSTVSTRSVIITGPPGAGKTHCLLQCILFSLCQGLFGITTAILAERAFLLGGQHFHKLFQIPVREHGYRVHRMAELAVVSLQKRPESISLLRSLDILFVDEMGQVSAELLSVLDIVMRRIRDSSLFMGGVLVVATLDQMQLRPIKELPFLLSPYVLTCFQMTKLKQYVRCSDCPVLQEMNEIARFFSNDQQEIDTKLARFRTLVASNCTFVDSWEDLQGIDDVLRIFPKRKHALDATRNFLVAKKKAVTAVKGQYLSKKAYDTMVPLESHGDWTEASSTVTNMLNRRANEPEQIDFFSGAVYQFTFNSPNKFNATQLCVLFDVPSASDLESFVPIKVMAAPPGTKILNIKEKPKRDLLLQGWKEVLVGAAPEYVQPMWHQGVKAKRKQYGLRHHIASTVHSAIGHTLYKVATQLSLAHGLWERAMVVVLISRVKYAKHIIFVGNKTDNIDALIKGLRIRCQYDDYMNHIVDVFCGDNRTEEFSRTIHFSQHPYRPRDIELPVDTSGVVYLLASTKKAATFYVGFTQNIRLRLKQHNSGFGSKSTADNNLRPWALVAYVTGFGGDRNLLQEFERSWQQKNLFIGPESIDACISLAEQLTKEDYETHNLVVVRST